MARMNRRQFTSGLAATAAMLALGPRLAKAQSGPAEVTKKLPKRYSGTTLRILFGTGVSWDILAANTREFTEATGIKLDFTMGQYMDRYTKMVLDVTTGTNSFDIYPIAYQWKYDVAPYLADLSWIDTEVDGAPPLDLADYSQRPLEIYSKVNGRLISLPVMGDVTFIVWNKKRYQGAGLDPERAPSSWAEIVANGKKMTTGQQYGYGMPAGKNIQAATVWMQLFNTYGGKYFDDKGQPQFNSKAGVDALDFMVNQLRPLSPPGILTWDISETASSFATEQSAQLLSWPSSFGIFADPSKSAAAGHFGWTTPPGGAVLGGHGVGINAKSRNLEAAKLFVAWFTSKEIVYRTALAGAAPVRMSAFKNPTLVEKYKFFPAVAKALAGPVFEFVPTKEAEQIHRMIFDEVNAAVAKTKTVQAAADDMQRNVVEFVKRRGR